MHKLPASSALPPGAARLVGTCEAVSATSALATKSFRLLFARGLTAVWDGWADRPARICPEADTSVLTIAHDACASSGLLYHSPSSVRTARHESSGEAIAAAEREYWLAQAILSGG